MSEIARTNMEDTEIDLEKFDLREPDPHTKANQMKLAELKQQATTMQPVPNVKVSLNTEEKPPQQTSQSVAQERVVQSNFMGIVPTSPPRIDMDVSVGRRRK